MKSIDKPYLSFLSQPLRPYKDSSTADKQSPFLKSLLSGNSCKAIQNRIVLNPNQNNYLKKIEDQLRNSSYTEDSEQNENGWYHNYE